MSEYIGEIGIDGHCRAFDAVSGAVVPVPDERVVALITLFAQCFSESANTRLECGGTEPLYLPADGNCSYNRVIFAHGYFASALHEVAHWCIAGDERRRLIDYGYWYCPDGRDADQQRRFEQVESRPQALEWIFSRAAAHRFSISVDNLAGAPTDPGPFRTAVCEAAQAYCRNGLPPSAAVFQRALARHFGGPVSLAPDDYTVDRLP